jgi:hypothetical protein
MYVGAPAAHRYLSSSSLRLPSPEQRTIPRATPPPTRRCDEPGTHIQLHHALQSYLRLGACALPFHFHRLATTPISCEPATQLDDDGARLGKARRRAGMAKLLNMRTSTAVSIHWWDCRYLWGGSCKFLVQIDLWGGSRLTCCSRHRRSPASPRPSCSLPREFIAIVIPVSSGFSTIILIKWGFL